MAVKSKRKTDQFKTVEEFVDYFDNNDVSEFIEEWPIVDDKFNLKSSAVLLPVEPALAQQLAEIAKSQNRSTEELVDSLLREQVSQTG